MNKSVTVAVVAHKPYPMPKDNMYLPLHVGAALHPGVLSDWAQDNTGDNISGLNPKFSELTGLYWLWKNNNSDYQGIVHYRRYFGRNSLWGRKTQKYFKKVVEEKEVQQLLKKTDIILPRSRNYYIETLYDHYAHTFQKEHLQLIREILVKQAPEYLGEFDSHMNQTKGHMFNMFIMKRSLVDEYCSWLFPALFELESRMDDEQYDSFQVRYPGRISEMLLDVWLQHKQCSYIELPVINIGRSNWHKKIIGFLQAKYAGKKYQSSF